MSTMVFFFHMLGLNHAFALELGYIAFDEDNDYDESVSGDVEDLWKAACSFEYSF